MKTFKDIREAVSPAQQAAIAISKKERGEKPKNEGSSAQSRLDRRAAKHGLGSKSRQDRIKKAKDFFSKPPPSYSKDDLRRMGHPVERKLTPAEMKKREKVAKAIERDNPDMPMDKKMAIATATAKKSA